MTQLMMRRPNLRKLPESEGWFRDNDFHRNYFITGWSRIGTAGDPGAVPNLVYGSSQDSERIRRDALTLPGVSLDLVAGNSDGVLVGMCARRRVLDEGRLVTYIHWIGVHPEYRRREIGTRLLATTLRSLASVGTPDVLLYVDSHRLAAIGFFLYFGFVPQYSAHGEDHQATWSRIFQQLPHRRSRHKWRRRRLT